MPYCGHVQPYWRRHGRSLRQYLWVDCDTVVSGSRVAAIIKYYSLALVGGDDYCWTSAQLSSDQVAVWQHEIFLTFAGETKPSAKSTNISC
jgi:hypothetical protein